MEACSEGHENKNKPLEEENRVKRKKKTPSQLEILEKTYAMETYPSEATRGELAVKLGLSDRQLQMWFCHRRQKDRKAVAPAGPSSVPMRDGVVKIEVTDVRNVSDFVSDLRPIGRMDLLGVVPLHEVMGFRRMGAALSEMDSSSSHEPHQTLHELQAIAFVESQLGESLRDDGPILGMEFDSVPLGAFGAPLEAVAVGQCRQPELSVEAKVYESLDKGVSKILHEYQFIPEQPTVKNEISERVTTAIHFSSLGGVPHSRTSLSSGAYFLNGNESAHNVYGVQGQKIPDLNLLSQSHQGRSNHLMPSASGGNDDVPRMNPFVDVTLETQMRAHQVTPNDGGLVPFDSRVIHEDEFSRFQRKRKNEEARIQRELEVQEKRIRKELVKQEILRQKREEQIKKEMERHDRERQKEEERLLRERQREEERFLREQRREQEQREKFLQKESIRIEKLRQKEELQRVKEAARIKAASERAVARRMVKDAMDLIEDERLELMELAASKKGLSSILALDYETMQNLESYRDGQTSFPPKSVQLKRAFSIQPWSDSDENVGNLLMVWRFLITFADILGIWPFTLDELIQAFHDYDPRILGEIHIALLRSIIKDIEDVARTPTTGLGGNQNSYTNSGGGHPQVVEGAYVWGFDIRNWQRHLNPLTWPEILRQFALSAGFGPQLKKHNIEQVHPSNNEVNDGKDIISNLRSGAAVENAVAIMQEKGLSNPRRHKHRLTPGTVKYAAFYVLALEGNRGLNILEIADKIQKSGLRDLTTSKSPEAAIASALSRDTELFERTAPSTYCVRPVYRKDPADSEAIFSAARERIRIFTSGFVGAEVADDGERDEDCESVMAKDPEIDDLGAQTNTKKEVSNFKEFNANTVMRSGKDNGEILQTRDSCREKVDEGLGLIVVESFDGRKDVRTSSEIAVCSNDIANPILKSMDVDENTLGEPWVQGLTEGEYSDLSVEERLHALVALITVTNEGNSIRVALEERLEAANALKKQMLAEAQLDKRHIKEDSFVKMQSFSYLGNKNEPAVTFPSLGGKQCPSHTVDVKNDKALLTPCGQREQIALQENQNPSQNSLLEVNMQSQDCSTGPDNYSIQQSIYTAEKARSNLKSYIDHLAEQTYMYRSLPLGLDRRRNRYWQFVTSASQNDPGAGRIFVELHDGCWKLIDSVEGFDALLVSLDLRGIRESHLHMMLQRIETSFKESVRRNVQNGEMIMQKGDTVKNLKKEAVKMAADLDCSADINCPTSVCIDDLDTSVASTSFTIQLGRNEIENKDAYMRYWDFEKWMRKECLNCSVSSAMKYGKKRCKQLLLICDLCGHVYFFREVQCPLCHRIFSTSQGNSSSYEHIAQSEGKMNIDADFFHDSSSSSTRMRLLKILLSVVEVTLPQEALQPFWTERYRKSWSSNLEASSSTEDILQMLTALEGAIKREYLASDYETTNELLDSVCSSGCLPNDIIGGEKIPVLPWVPFTTAAVALRLMDLDACIFYTSQQKQETKKDSKTGIVVKLPLKCAAAKNSCDGGAIETSFQTKHTVKNWGALGAGLESYNKGQRTRQGRSHSRGQRSQGIVTSSRSTSKKRSTTSNSRKEGRLLGWKGTPNGQGHTRGRRSIRSRKKPAAKMDVITSERGTPKDITELTAISAREEIDGGREANALNARNSERSEYEDDVCQATRDKYDFVVDNNNNNGRYQGGFSGNPDNLIEQNHYNVDDEEDVDMDDSVNNDGKYGQVELNVEDYIIGGDSDEEYNKEENEDPDRVGSTSSGYSD